MRAFIASEIIENSLLGPCSLSRFCRSRKMKPWAEGKEPTLSLPKGFLGFPWSCELGAWSCLTTPLVTPLDAISPSIYGGSRCSSQLQTLACKYSHPPTAWTRDGPARANETLSCLRLPPRLFIICKGTN